MWRQGTKNNLALAPLRQEPPFVRSDKTIRFGAKKQRSAAIRKKKE
jgi:hypothetical protein